MSRKLTDIRIKSLKAPANGRLVEVDGEVPGLCIRVTAIGAKSWLIRYRVKGRQGQRCVVPGTYPIVPLSAARQRAREIIAAAKRGEDLVEEERRRIAAALAATPDTVANIAEGFIRRALQGRGRAPSYVAATRRMFDEHMLPRWRGRDIRSITRRDVVALLDGIVDDGKPVLANRMLAAVRAMFNWAIRRGIIETSPATLVERPAAERPRERVLSADEIKAIWSHFDALGYPFGPFFQMALITAQRREEVAHMRWADLDFDERTWNLGANQTKACRAHVVPLSSIALDILTRVKTEAKTRSALENENRATVRRATGRAHTPTSMRGGPLDSDFVFTSCRTTEDRPISGFGKAKARIDRAVEIDCTKHGLKHLSPWTIHDLRRTAASGLGKLQVSRFIIGRVLNHADSSVTGIYDRHAYLAEKRNALEAWGAYIGNLISVPSPKVVALRNMAIKSAP